MNTLSIKYVTASWLLAAAVFLGFALQAFAQEAIETQVITSEEVTVSEALPADIFVPVEDILTPPSIVLLVSEPASTTEAVVMDESTTSQEVIVSEAVLSTDKDDYHPGETATIFGRFFAPLETFMIKVFGIDENNQNYTETEKEITADANGEFSFSYLLDSLYRPFYEVVVSTLGGEKIAETWFRDSSVGTYDQCSNDDGDGYAIADTGCRWTQGNIQSNNSTYFEGDSTVQRLWMEGYVPGSSHTITFKYGTTKGGSHAYDYLTTWNASENWVTVADRCQDVTGCTTASETTAVMQNDPNVTDSIEPAGASRLFTIRGATITNVSVPTIVTGSYAGDSETVVTIAFTVGAANGPMCSTKKVQGQDVTSCGMAVWFGAHVAKGSEWTAFNSTTGAGAIPGSPYHVALDAEDGTSIGQRDNQMQSAAIVQTSSITIIKDAVPNDAQDFAFTTTGTGLSGFSLDDDTNATLSNTKVFNSLTAGTYTITEGTVAGWSLTGNLNCVDPTTNSTINLGTRTATINLAAGENVTCTFVNTLQTGNIIIVKDAVPNDAQDFAFTNNFGNSNPASFSLDDDADGTLLNSRNSVVTAGTYAVSEGAVSGWAQTSATCSDGSPINAVVVSAGETVTCTFTNTKKGHLIVQKTTLPAGDLTSFSILASGSGTITGAAASSVTDATDKDYEVTPGTYSVAETVPVGWTKTGDTCQNVTVAAGETKTCLLSNTKKGHIIVDKVTNPSGDAQSFSFTTTGAGYSDFSLTDVAAPNNQEVLPGAYTVAEGAVAGWSSDGGSCDNGETPASLDVGPGETVTCTFTNTKQARLIVDKVTNPSGDTQSFNFTTNAGSNFSLTDVAAPHDSGVVAPGTYSVSETVPSGWDQSSATCSDGSPIGAVVLSAGETVTCTFTNTKRGEIVLVKNTIGGDGAFDFTHTIAGLDTNLVTAAGTDSDTSDKLLPGDYVISETAPAGWDLTSATCDSDETVANITVGAGETVTCTFTNTKKGQLTVQKTTVPAGDTTSFSIVASGSGTITGGGAGTITDATDKVYEVTPGTYSVAETVPTGWVKTGDTCQNVAVAAGESKTCLITNTKNGSITIEKQVVGTDKSFTFTGSIAASLADNQTATLAVAPGNYSVIEGADAAYALTSLTCSDSDSTGSTNTRTASFVVAAGENVTCVFTNSQLPKLTLVKTVTNDNGGTAVTTDFQGKINGNNVPWGSAQTLTAGSFTASETNLPNYTASSWGGDCAADGSITLAYGDSKTCTITNNDNAPILHLRKVVVNDNGGTATLANFTLTANGTGANDISGTSPVDSSAALDADTFALSETNVAGYAASDWVCVGGTQVGANITLGLGEEATCTITNDDIAPKLHLRKVVVNDNGGTASVAAWTLTADGATTNDVTGNSPVDSTGSLLADTFALSESGGPSGYSASAWSCVGGTQNGANITLGIGGEATCTITNNDQPAHLIVVKHVDNGNTGATTAASAFTTTITGVTTSNQSTTGAEAPGVDNTLTTIGAYSIDEGAHVGYTKILSSGCTGTIALGETKTCTITNTAIAPRLTLIKTVINGNGGTKVVADFPLFVDATGVTSGTANNTTIGAHTASETGNVGYLASDWGGDCAEDGSVTLALADDKTCTITNDDIAPKLHLRKVVTNDNGGTKTIADFTLTANGTGANDLSGTSPVDSDGTLKADTFALSETNVTEYNASAWTCVGGTQVGANITLGINEEATCTITNDDIAPSLTLNKVTSYQYGGNAPESSWTLNADGGSAGLLSGPGAAGSADVVSSNTFQAGTYTLSESAAPTGYQNGTSYSCVKNGGTAVSSNSLALGVGDSATCTITNTDLPAHIIVIKHVINDNGNDAVASDFTMRLTGTQLSQNDFAGSETGVDVTLDAGAYTVDETNSAGYIKTLSADCSGTVAVGQTKTCTITNNDKPMATRTQGFWQTHTVYTSSVFSGKSWTIGTKVIDTPAELFAGFYASLPKTTTGAKRTSLDHARMQMLQQWLAAKLNCAAFGCSSTTQTLLTNAATAFSGTNKTLILNYASQLDAYNNSNDALLISGQGKATPQTSQSTASTQLSFWNILP